MAMTKKERAEFDARLLKAETLAALRWTGEVEPDIPVPKTFGTSSGWSFNVHTRKVDATWSESAAHGYGLKRDGNRSASQGGISMYSTKELALAALRHAVELESAAALLSIDKQIEAAKS